MTYSAAPTTDKDTAKAIPVEAHMYGVMLVRNLFGGFNKF